MFELLTTDGFATWFSALESGPAEDVAATLEVIVQLGTRTEAPGSSRPLLPAGTKHPLISPELRPRPDEEHPATACGVHWSRGEQFRAT